MADGRVVLQKIIKRGVFRDANSRARSKLFKTVVSRNRLDRDFSPSNR